ncbi:hypothetical protein SNE40_018591 [Patella caerulea]|uniref:UBA domain-containing protein n=1 Tax=Patella caerulea TaxID=87958 RepID=A0AAN8J7T4_PATCE
MQQAGTRVGNHWAAGGVVENNNSWGEDGGWSQGPKVTGSGWTETGLSSENSQDIGTWQNPQRSDQNWNQNINSVIVDSTDKEAWPSIRPGESVSDAGDDSGSAKSGSVISSSSNQGQNIDITKVSSAMQSQSASSPWGATSSTFGGIESNPWGSGNSPSPSAANQNSLGWSSSNPHPSLSVNNQGHNMQTGTSSPGSDNISNSKNLNPPISSLGWGSGAQGLGAHRPQNSMQSTSNGNNVHGMLPSISGAQQSGPNVSSSLNGSNPWPSNSMGDLSGFPKTSESGWNNTVAVTNNGASAGKDKRGNNSEPNVESESSVWGKSSSFGASGWDQNPGNIKPPTSGSQWDSGNTKSQWGDNPSGAAKSQGSGNNPEHLSWAQAACKGLPPSGNSGNDKIPSEQQMSHEPPSEISRAIDCHEGWGRKPVCQNSSWDLELSKSSQATRVDDGGAANVWDNNNGTAIWEASRDNQNRNPSGWNGATSGPQWNKEKESNQWNGPGPGPDNNHMGGGSSDGSIGNWNVPDNSANAMWGGKTDTGQWKDTSSWEDPRQQEGTGQWHGEMTKPKSWSSTPSTPSTPITPGNGMLQKNEEWMKSGPTGGGVGGGNGSGNRPTVGWGNPSNGGDRVDDGTSIWAGNAQQQARASGWGDTGSQWNPTVGAKNKSSWNEGENNWNSANRKQDWTDERGGWGSMDVGYWNDISQENSSWSSASGWKNKQQMVKMPPNKFPPSSGYHPPNQMRVRLLEQLIAMGYKKDDAQTALINNNMNFEGAVAELTNNGAKKDTDMDVFQANGVKAKTGMLPDGSLNDISDTHLDSNPHVPNFPIQNTPPFQNAQVPNQPFMSMYDRSKIGASLPSSSPNPMNSSINPALQPKFMPQKLQQQHQAQSLSPTQGPLTRSQVPGQNPGQNVVHQQMAQQQILQQLRMAVQSGLISPQLLNQQLPHNILLLLQQLLQYQTALQQLVTRQSMIQKNKMPPQSHDRPLQQMIINIRQQILNIQKQISQAQPPGLKNTQQPNPDMDPLLPLQTELNNLSMNASTVHPQPQSRLTQWKSGNGDKENDIDNLNKAVGSKPMHQSQSSPNLGRFEDLSMLNISGDTTWSTIATTASQNWPSASIEGTTDGKDSSDLTKESLALTTASSVNLTDVIPEFVPGKPWQGFNNKSVEDDPHITPGSFSRSFSVNVVKDDYLDNLSLKTPSTSAADWGKGPNSSKNWNPESGMPEWSSGSMQNAMGSGRQPPGFPLHGNRSNNWQRQNSWAGRTDNSAFTPVGNWDKSPKMQWLILKNISHQIDSSTLKTLCQQHGPLSCFVPLQQLGSALVCYSSKEEAAKAQRALNQCVLGGTTIFAEFITEEDASRFAKHSAMNVPSQQWSQNQQQQQQQQMSQLNNAAAPASPWSLAPTPYLPSSGSGSMWGSSLWGGASDDHNSNPLVNNILGGQSM